MNDQRTALLEVKNLKKYFPVEKGFLRRIVGHVRAVDDVSFVVNKGETLGIVGESGCGKTTLGRCIIRAMKPTGGEINFALADGSSIPLNAMTKRSLHPHRRHMHMIFQDPFSSLDPRMTIMDIVSEPIKSYEKMKRTELQERVTELIKVVGLEEQFLKRFPHAFSGGQRQRIGIARSLALNPDLVICDEAVSALDVSIQAQILNLLQDLQKKFQLTYIFIAHNLSVIEYISDRVAVMYVGKIVELTATRELFAHPKHPYTAALLSAVPKTNPKDQKNRILLSGEVANPANPPTGCYFHPRCRYVMDVCKKEYPAWREVEPNHFVACHRRHTAAGGPT